MKHFTSSNGKMIGTLFDDGVFRKKVSGKIHRYKNEDGWGIDVSVLDELPQGTEIRILDKDDGVVYITTKEVFESGTKIDFGYGEQIVLWRKYFDTSKNGVKTKSEYVQHWMADYSLFKDYGRK